jgi:hypothetical protein
MGKRKEKEKEKTKVAKEPKGKAKARKARTTARTMMEKGATHSSSSVKHQAAMELIKPRIVRLSTRRE